MPVRHVVQPGECLLSLATRYGFADWQAIFEHPDNSELKEKRKTPSVLHPGDVVSIPEKADKQVEVATGAVHTFKVKLPKAMVRIALQVHGSYGYELSVDGERWTGKTDGSAPIEHAISPDARDGELLLWPDTEGNDEAREGLQRIPLLLGHLDPVEEISGIQGVLGNLGHYYGPVDGRESDAMKAAIAAFQAKVGLARTGEIDDALRDKLRAEHDG